MAHEITSNDGLVLHRHKAWHGLGTIVEDAATPAEALKLAGLDWEVQQWALSATDGEDARCSVSSHVANVRTDTRSVLGVVGKGWSPFQNQELADFAASLSESGQVKCETAGSIRGGAKVWFLLKGESFAVRGQDEVKPYVLVSNGFDGGTALRVTPTTIRVVCSNTLHMVIPRYGDDSKVEWTKPASIKIAHFGDIKQRVEAARQAMLGYSKRLDENREMIDALATRDMSSTAVERFFLECFAEQFGAVAASPKDAKEQRHRDKAKDCIRRCVNRFESEKQLAGTTAWNAFNAYSGWLQHERLPQIKNAAARLESQTHSNLFGDNADRTVEAFTLALTLAS